MQIFKEWIKSGRADRFRNGRILNSLGMVVIVVLFFALTLINVVFRLKLETAGKPPGSLDDVRDYTKPGAEKYDGDRESLIHLRF